MVATMLQELTFSGKSSEEIEAQCERLVPDTPWVQNSWDFDIPKPVVFSCNSDGALIRSIHISHVPSVSTNERYVICVGRVRVDRWTLEFRMES